MQHSLNYRSPSRAVVALASLLVCWFVALPTQASPEAKILRVDPRAAQDNGNPVLTTVVEVSQSKRVSDAIGWSLLQTSPEARTALAALTARGWKLGQIFITHHHSDHIDGIAAMVAATGARVLGAEAARHRPAGPRDRARRRRRRGLIGRDGGRHLHGGRRRSGPAREGQPLRVVHDPGHQRPFVDRGPTP